MYLNTFNDINKVYVTMKIVYTIAMNQDIYNLAYELKDLLSNDERICLLNSLEEKMNNDHEVISLAYQKDMACLKYSDALNHYSEDSKEVKDAQRELYEKKLSLDNNEIVRNYLKAFSDVRDLYREINDILFGGLNIKMKEHK